MILLFLWETQKFKDKSLLSLEKKKTFAGANFSKICWNACPINCSGKFICLHAYLHEHSHVGLTDKLEETIWAKWPKIAWKTQNQHFWVKTVRGPGKGQANFSGSGWESPQSPPDHLFWNCPFVNLCKFTLTTVDIEFWIISRELW